MGIRYASVETVRGALDAAEVARHDAAIGRALDAATGAVEGLLHRRFYPWTGVRHFDWPQPYTTSWRLWLDKHDLISVTTLTVAGTAVASTDYFLRPYDGPPHTHLEIDLASSAAFSAGSTHQQAVAITGVWGYTADEQTAGTLTEALDASETGVDVSDSAAIGVGHIIRVDSERMIVTAKTMLTTGQTVQTTALTASNANVTVLVTTGSAYSVGETILIDSERMLIVDISGNSLTVKRAHDGTVLAAHNTGVTIYAPRTLTVERGALGTTAATHSTSATIYRHVVPGPVQSLAVAEALDVLLQDASGWARASKAAGLKRAGTAANRTHDEAYGIGLDALREAVYASHGRKARVRAV